MDTTHHYGVAVGINLYPGISHLAGAREDASKFHKWLTGPGGLPEGNAFLVTAPGDDTGDVPPDGASEDPFDAEPQPWHVYRPIQGLWQTMHELQDKDPDAWLKSRLYLFVSGHGFSPEPRDVALLTANASADYFDNVSCQAIINFLLRYQSFREILVFADCCRDIVPHAEAGTPPWSKGSREYYKSTHLLSFATDLGTKAFEGGNGERRFGYYTKALIEGLEGQARNKDTGNVDILSLNAFLRERVQILTEERDSPQQSQMYGDLADPMVIVPSAKLVDGDLSNVQITFKQAFAGEVGIYQTEAPLDTFDGAQYPTPWNLQLANGIYQVRHLSDEVDLNLEGSGYFTVMGGSSYVEL